MRLSTQEWAGLGLLLLLVPVPVWQWDRGRGWFFRGWEMGLVPWSILFFIVKIVEKRRAKSRGKS